MAAYIVSEVEVRDPERMARYRMLAQDSIARHGGRYLVRGGAIEVLEGGPTPKLLIIVEFPTMEQARAWYASADYGEALKVRADALDRRLLLVEGVPPA